MEKKRRRKKAKISNELRLRWQISEITQFLKVDEPDQRQIAMLSQGKPNSKESHRMGKRWGGGWRVGAGEGGSGVPQTKE